MDHPFPDDNQATNGDYRGRSWQLTSPPASGSEDLSWAAQDKSSGSWAKKNLAGIADMIARFEQTGGYCG